MDPQQVVGNDEKIISVTYKHWVNLVPMMAACIIILFAALVGFYALGRYSEALGGEGFALLALVALVVLDVMLGYISYFVYRRNQIILTDKNFYQLTQKSLFNRSIMHFDLDRVQDVNVKQYGFFANNLDYGDVIVETAGEEHNPQFTQVPAPKELAARIMEEHQKKAYTSPSPSGEV